MLKSKKRILSIVMSFVMLLALSCGAWAADAVVSADGVHKDANGDIINTGNARYGLWALNNNGSIKYTGGTITTDGSNSHAIYAYNQGVVDGSGTAIVTNGIGAGGLYLDTNADVKWVGNITTNDNLARGANVTAGASVDVTGDITTNGSSSAHGAFLNQGSYGKLVGDITTSGVGSHGVFAYDNSYADVEGKIVTNSDDSHGIYSSNVLGSTKGSYSFIELVGDIATHGTRSNAVFVYRNANAKMTGNIATYGNESHGIYTSNETAGDVYSKVEFYDGTITTYGAGSNAVTGNWSSDIYLTDVQIVTENKGANGLSSTYGSTITMAGGTVRVEDELAYAMYVGDGTINLENISAEGQNLLRAGNVSNSSGVFNAKGSTLAGKILHNGNTDEILEVNFEDSTWSGAANTSSDLGAIDMNLKDDSVWNVTGDSDTNGKLVVESGSRVDYNDAPAGTTVTVDTYEGSGDLNMKPGDKLVIKDGDSVVDLKSSDDDVIEVVKNEEDGSYEIISKGEGNAELDYTYIDGNGDEQTVTIGVAAIDSIETTTSGSPDPDNIYPGDEVGITYSFTSDERDAQVVGVVESANFADSGLSAKIDSNGDVILEGTAETPGSYYIDVNMLIDGTLVQRRVVVTVNGGFEPAVTGGDPEAIQPGDDVDITYDFGDENEVVGLDGSGLAGSDLTVGVDADGNIVLEGTAGEPGNYFFEVEIKDENGKVRKQKMPVNIEADFETHGTPEDGKIESGMDVELYYDFTPYLPILVDNLGMDGSGLLADIVGGEVVLKGTAGDPGSFYYVVTLRRGDGTTFTQTVPVIVEGASTPTGYSGGGSSNCNAGLGFGALLSLLGMAVIQKRK